MTTSVPLPIYTQNTIYHLPSQKIILTCTDERLCRHTIVSSFETDIEDEIFKSTDQYQYEISYTNNTSSFIYNTRNRMPHNDTDETDHTSLVRMNIYLLTEEELVIEDLSHIINLRRRFHVQEIINVDNDATIYILGVEENESLQPSQLIKINLSTLEVEDIKEVFPLHYRIMKERSDKSSEDLKKRYG